MAKQNYLLGKGERLTEDIDGTSGGGAKIPAYTFEEAKKRLSPRLRTTVQQIDDLPDIACPDDNVVISITLNPEYIAKSYFPQNLLQRVHLTAVGSKPKRVTPEKRSLGRAPEEVPTTEIFVMGSRSSLRNWSQSLPGWNSPNNARVSNAVAKDLVAIEDIAAIPVSDKIKGPLPDASKSIFEVVLHTDELSGETGTMSEFKAYLKVIGVEADLERRFYAGGLCFVEVEAESDLADRIAEFSVVRAMRQMPNLRILRPMIRASNLPTQALALPTSSAVSDDVSIAIFDGGLPVGHPLTEWVTPHETAGLAAPVEEYLTHGVGVTSAALFGHLNPKSPIPVPYANIDHYRVLDSTPGQNPHELYDVLARIEEVLSPCEYDFINISLGPRLPIEDDEVHAWTSVLDKLLSRADTLATIAVGNDGEGDEELGLNRIQVPADCVNALAIGACDSPASKWQRAPYSSVGPGRSPGRVKPDMVDFGGSMERPFLVVSNDEAPGFDSTGGTSFSAPSVMRLGAGIRSHLGSEIDILSVKALLIHTAESAKLSKTEIGWGRAARTLEDIIIVNDDTIRVIYQGAISPAKYIRAPIPMPLDEIEGMVSITATLCHNSITDPHHPSNYTRSGLEVAFRPHSERFKDAEKQQYADTKPFFSATKRGMGEAELRRDAWKWENCQHTTKNMRGSSLYEPCFDIHYNARLEGRNSSLTEPLSYSLVVSVTAKNVKDLYDQVVRKYASQLEPLQPVLEIPLRNTNG